MNKQQQQINKSIKKVMRKLVAFSLGGEGRSDKSHLQPKLGFDSIWIYHFEDDGCSYRYILFPESVNEIHEFEINADRIIAGFRKNKTLEKVEDCDRDLGYLPF